MISLVKVIIRLEYIGFMRNEKFNLIRGCRPLNKYFCHNKLNVYENP